MEELFVERRVVGEDVGGVVVDFETASMTDSTTMVAPVVSLIIQWSSAGGSSGVKGNCVG